MIERLDLLTLSQLIELSCGNFDVLLEGKEKPDEEATAKVVNKIFGDYLSIASPKQAKMNISSAEETTKLRMKEKCLRICIALCSQKHPELAKSVLLELDVDENLLTTDEKIKTRCKAMLDEVEYEIKRTEELNQDKEQNKKQSAEEIRKSWYSEIAFVMSTLKMSIDPKNINAAIYANLVHQASERSKTLAKAPPSLGMLL